MSKETKDLVRYARNEITKLRAQLDLPDLSQTARFNACEDLNFWVGKAAAYEISIRMGKKLA